MKRLVLTVLIIGVGACGKKPMPAASRPAAAEEKRAVERRVRTLDQTLAKGDTPETPEVIASNLTPQALREFSTRIPNAANIESNLRFSGPGVAVVSVNYTLPESPVLRTQIIEFAFMNEQWNMSWKPDPADDDKATKAQPATP